MGGLTLRAAGFALNPVGQGADDGYEIRRARKTYVCDHHRQNGGRLELECTGPIRSGDRYARVRQSWLDWAPVTLACLLAADVITAADG
jgi:hypothetical protein